MVVLVGNGVRHAGRWIASNGKVGRRWIRVNVFYSVKTVEEEEEASSYA
jgi:hypothetical protein